MVERLIVLVALGRVLITMGRDELEFIEVDNMRAPGRRETAFRAGGSTEPGWWSDAVRVSRLKRTLASTIEEFCTPTRLGGRGGQVGLEFGCLRTFLTLPWYVSRRVSSFM